MGMAVAASTRATCQRRKVGAVLIKGSQIVSSGYNGAPEGLEHCLDVGCEMGHGHCIRCIHAEANAIIQAGLGKAGTAGTTIYTTASPCRGCMGLIINARIAHVVYSDPYKDPTHEGDQSQWAMMAAVQLGIKMTHLKVKPTIEYKRHVEGESER